MSTLASWDHYDAPRYYVDPEEGDDATARVDDPSRPWKTILFLSADPVARNLFAGRRAIIALRCGRDHYGTLRCFSGESQSAPFVVCSYGEGSRPRVLPADKDKACMTFSQSASSRPSGVQDVHVSDVELYFDFFDPDSPRFDLTAKGGGGGITSTVDGSIYRNLTFLGVVWRHKGPTFQGFRIIAECEGVVLRQCIIADTYGTTAHNSGIYTAKFALTVEDSLLLHNGHAREPRVRELSIARHRTEYGDATIYNHNAYMDPQGLKFRRNIVWHGASMGLKLRRDEQLTGESGLEVLNNLFIDNEFPIGGIGNTTLPERCWRPVIADNVSIDDGKSPHTKRNLSWPYLFNGMVDPVVASNIYAFPRKPGAAFRFPNFDCQGGLFVGNAAIAGESAYTVQFKLRSDGAPMQVDGNKVGVIVDQSATPKTLMGDNGPQPVATRESLPIPPVEELLPRWLSQRLGAWDESIMPAAINAAIRRHLGVAPYSGAEPPPPLPGLSPEVSKDYGAVLESRRKRLRRVSNHSHDTEALEG